MISESDFLNFMSKIGIGRGLLSSVGGYVEIPRDFVDLKRGMEQTSFTLNNFFIILILALNIYITGIYFSFLSLVHKANCI